ncbi:MAG: hypothetical protein WDZ35_16275, partial [Crocinitomicaceae bacterium]
IDFQSVIDLDKLMCGSQERGKKKEERGKRKEERGKRKEERKLLINRFIFSLSVRLWRTIFLLLSP